MSLEQTLLDGAQARNFTVARAFHRLQVAMARRRDPLVRYRLNGAALWLPLSHDLPWNRRVFPTYSDNLRRLAAFVRQRAGGLRLIDAGANVGDSWALCGSRPGDTFLLIEGSPSWFALLERNTGGDPAVTRVQTLLSDQEGAAAGAIVTEEGNARVVESPGTGLPTETIDRLVARHPAFRAANLLKVDVEGWDPKVLRGARALLADASPAILFEHHPRLLALAGEDDRAVFGELAELGYRRTIVYDNTGMLIGALDAADGARIGALVDDARRRDGFYYDVCAFSDRDADAREAFLASEVAWYASRSIDGAGPAPRAAGS